MKDKISLTSKSGPGGEKRNALKAELDGIRGQQSTNKLSRGKVFDQLKALQDGVQKKVGYHTVSCPPTLSHIERSLD